MILSIQQIKSIIVDKPNQAIIAKGTEYNKLLRLHLYGSGLDSSLTEIKEFEGKSLYSLRAKYSRSNKDLFSRLGRPIDKVFSARGGSIYYNLADAQDKQARNLSLNVWNDLSIRKWVENYWKPHFLDDPFGVMLLEILPAQDAILAKQQGRSFVYPTYKPISSIYDYSPKGSGLDYIVFKVSSAEKKAAGMKDEDQVYRVVDDAFDYWVKRDGDEVRIIAEHSYQNYFGKVPALINSDIVSAEDEQCYLSLYDEVIELANHFMLTGSIRITHQFLHGFPKYWQYATSCNSCGGTGYQNGETCQDCKGSKRQLMHKVSDAMSLEMPTKDDQKITPDVAGYVSPDKTYFEISTTDLQLLEDAMNVTLWGASSKMKTQPMMLNQQGEAKTATEVMDDIKPQADRLNIISEMAEKRHKFILDNVVRLQITPAYNGASVNYGRRYMIEGPDEIWNKYSDARTKGAAVSVLDDLLLEYYETKYSSDPIKLAIQLKLMKVEPFVHLMTLQTDASPSITQEDKAAKTYFSEWLSTLNDGMILTLTPDLLRQQLIEFSKSKAEAVQAAKEKDVMMQAKAKQPIAA